MADEAVENAPIGPAVKTARLTGVTVRKVESKFSTPRVATVRFSDMPATTAAPVKKQPTVAAPPVPTAMAPAPAPPKVVVVPPPTEAAPAAMKSALWEVAPAPPSEWRGSEPRNKLRGPPPAPTAGPAPTPTVRMTAKKAEAEGVVRETVRKETARLKKGGIGATSYGAAPPTGDFPAIERRTFLKAPEMKELRQRIMTPAPSEVSLPQIGYSPITSSSYRDFMIQTFKQYSPILQRILREGSADFLKEPKVIDKEACKRRSEQGRDLFYYQKFVRDYLRRDTPYRGLLVYHGLGSGKTCTSIAAAEALYWGGQRTIYVMTPATLSNNFRRELATCGFYPLRKNNYWRFLPTDATKKPGEDQVSLWLVNVLGLPLKLVEEQRGGWVPDPDAPNNWESLSPENQDAIRRQQDAHMNHRFRIIHYNGESPETLAALAMEGVAEGTSLFDNAVVIIDEVHNLVRTINGTQLGGKPVSTIIKEVEPREFTWSAPLGRERPGYRYPRGYTLYRLLQNAVDAKVIALSATPMINYAQELSILMNIIGGEQRTVEISLRSMARDPATFKQLEAWAKERPDVDFYSIEQAADRSTVLILTPVPYGFNKVISDSYDTRGFVRGPAIKDGVKMSNERNMDIWGAEMVRDLVGRGILPPATSEAADAAVKTRREGGPGSPLPSTSPFQVRTLPMLPEDGKEFVENFIDKMTLKIMNGNVLKARCNGLISYYKGNSEELMPRVGVSEVVEVPFSEYAFKQYSAARLRELEMEKKPAATTEDGKEAAKPRGLTAAEVDLYTQVTKAKPSGFLTLTRAACNWVYPEDVPRPTMNLKARAAQLGIQPDNKVISVDAVVDTDMEVAEGADIVEDEGVPVAGGAGAAPETSDAEAVAEGGASITDIMAGLRANAADYLNVGLTTFSPKYAAMLENIRKTTGPVLVYSQFKTLEGLGIFAEALKAADEGFVQLDIKRGADGAWTIFTDLVGEDGAPVDITDPAYADRPRFILYTGDQELEKRRLLLQLYNADVSNLPPTLSAQCAALLRGQPDNRAGAVCKAFMITQSGAEGISLKNTRQVHLMEPYWNNVRMEQVIGRAIRLCSHADLPWEERVVDVYTYVSVFTDEQKATGAKQIMMIDKQMTTDQVIYDIASKKQVLANGLFEVVQSASADCDIHFYEHGEAVQCFRFAEGAGRPMFMFHPDWRKDVITAQTAMRSAAPTRSSVR